MSDVFDTNDSDCTDDSVDSNDKHAERLYIFWRDAAQRNFTRKYPNRILPDNLRLPWGALGESERDNWRAASMAFFEASKTFHVRC